MAQVEIIDLRQRMRGRQSSEARAGAAKKQRRSAVPLSPPLVDALRANLAAGGQSMVFLNRRGYHNFLQCHLCGNVIACPNCSVSMTFHLRDRSLRCHYCGERCAGARSLSRVQRFRTCRDRALAPSGSRRRWPNAAAGAHRADGQRYQRAARSARRDPRRRCARGEIDILVGTQMITKGFDFPGVTLVGVVLADLALNLPDFRSAERTFQLLTQVAGRAGRGERPGRVLIQTYAPHHYSIRAARDQDYARFMRRELDLRRELDDPPFTRLAMVRIEGADAAAVASIGPFRDRRCCSQINIADLEFWPSRECRVIVSVSVCSIRPPRTLLLHLSAEYRARCCAG